jgi:hypothetical protein
MPLQIPAGFSVSLAVAITDGPLGADGVTVPVDATTPLTEVRSDDVAKVRVVYPDPTPGVANPARSIRVDMLPGTPVGVGSNIHARYTSPYDGSVRNLSELATAVRAPNAGVASIGTASDPFPTPVTP